MHYNDYDPVMIEVGQRWEPLDDLLKGPRIPWEPIYRQLGMAGLEQIAQAAGMAGDWDLARRARRAIDRRRPY